MERTPEPDLMDEPAQALAYAQADFSEPHDAFVDAFSACFPDFSAGEVLDLGCGPADISCRFARRYPDVHVTGVDGAAEMLRLGTQRLAKQHLQGRVSLIQAYLPHDSFTDHKAFDAIISNSLLHHLRDPVDLWATVVENARAGTAIFVMDLRRPDTTQVAHALVDQYAAGEPDILQRDFYHSLCAAYRPEEIHDQLQAAGLQLDIRTISDRHLTISGFISTK